MVNQEEREAQLPRELVDALESIADGLVKTMGSNWEIAVHDFGLLPSSIVAIAGDLTGRTKGGPMTAFGFRLLAGDTSSDVLNYSSTTRDGRKLKSSTIFIRDTNGTAIGCMCINMDVTEFDIARRAIDRLCNVENGGRPNETFARDVPEALGDYLRLALERADVSTHLMTREQKLSVVAHLDYLGVFRIRGAVDCVAKALLVSKYTVYNYIEEVRAGSGKYAF